MNEVLINTDTIKLDQFLKWAGIVESGGDAKEMVLSGNVKVNGEVAHERGKKLHKGDKIYIDNHGEFIII